jgi:hypothetical protein
MKKDIALLSLIFVLIAYPAHSQMGRELYPFSTEYNPQRLLLTIDPPPGFERTSAKKLNLFQAWVTNLPLNNPRMPVARWDGQRVMGIDSITAVIDFGVGTPQQRNADIPIQLLMEFLRATNSLGDFPIIIGKGDTITYNKWLGGEYYLTAAQEVAYRKADTMRPPSDKEYYRFLQYVLNETEIESLLKNLTPISEDEIAPGTLYIQKGNGSDSSGGHVAVILEVCANKKGEALVLAGWGGNPAHSFYVARPLPVSDMVWFSIPALKQHLAEYGDGGFYRFSAQFRLPKDIK